MKIQSAPLEAEYARLRARLAHLGWISHGYVQDRGPGAGGPCYQWTRKVKGKTVSVALSQAQYQALRAAIVNWKETQEILEAVWKVVDDFPLTIFWLLWSGSPTSWGCDTQLI